jgi:N-glycosidase YbiA
MLPTKDNIINFYMEDTLPYGCFSNYYISDIVVFDQKWKTCEHAFQSQKYKQNSEPYIAILECTHAWRAREIGQSRMHPIRADWEDIKDNVMYEVIKAKFEQNYELTKILLSTGTKFLVHRYKNDKYWGNGGDGSGKNMLGIILMKVRAELQKEMLLYETIGIVPKDSTNIKKQCI